MSNTGPINILTTPRAEIEEAFKKMGDTRFDLEMQASFGQPATMSFNQVYQTFKEDREYRLKALDVEKSWGRSDGRGRDIELIEEDIAAYHNAFGRYLRGGMEKVLYRILRGMGGGNQYYVNPNGDIEFSLFYYASLEKWIKAVAVGFLVDGEAKAKSAANG